MSLDAPALKDEATRRLPYAVYAIALGIFVIGTSEFMIAGLLPQIADSLHVSIPRAGLLMTAFAVGMLVGAPVMALLTLALPQRLTLLGALAVVALAHAAPLVLSGYPALATGRVVAAVATATYWAVGAVIAVQVAGPGAMGRALAVIVGGLTASNVLGVPVGTWLGEQLDWKAPFVAVSIAALITLVLLRALLPATPRPVDVHPRALAVAEVRAMRGRGLWLALATTMVFETAYFCTFTYVAPLLTDVSGIPERYVAPVLFIFGIGALLGVTVGGRIADRNLMLNVLGGLVAVVLALLLFQAVAAVSAAAVGALFLLGAAGFSLPAALSTRVLGFARAAPTLGAALSVTAFNIGNALGPWIGGTLIDAGAGLRVVVWASVVITLGALGVAAISWRVDRSAHQ